MASFYDGNLFAATGEILALLDISIYFGLVIFYSYFICLLHERFFKVFFTKKGPTIGDPSLTFFGHFYSFRDYFCFINKLVEVRNGSKRKLRYKYLPCKLFQTARTFSISPVTKISNLKQVFINLNILVLQKKNHTFVFGRITNLVFSSLLITCLNIN